MPVDERIAECSPSLAAALKEFLKEEPLFAKRSFGCCGPTTEQLLLDLAEKIEEIKTAILKGDGAVDREIMGVIQLLQRFRGVDCQTLLGGRTDEANVAILKSWFAAEVLDIATTKELTELPTLKDFFRDQGMPQVMLWQQLAQLNAFAEWSSARAEFLRKLSVHQIAEPDRSTVGGKEAFRLYTQVKEKLALIDQRKGSDDIYLCDERFLSVGKPAPTVTPIFVLNGVEANYREATRTCEKEETAVTTLIYIQQCVSLLHASLRDDGPGQQLLAHYANLAQYFIDPLELNSCSVYELDAKVAAGKMLERTTRLFCVSENKRLYLIGSYARDGQSVVGYVDSLDPEVFGEVAKISVTSSNFRTLELGVRSALGYATSVDVVTAADSREITRRMHQLVEQLAFQKAALHILINWAQERNSRTIELTESLTCGRLLLDGAIAHVYGVLLASVKQIFPEYRQGADEEVVRAVLTRAGEVVDPEEIEFLPAAKAQVPLPPAEPARTPAFFSMPVQNSESRIANMVSRCARFRTTQNIKGGFDDKELRGYFEKAIADKSPLTTMRLMKAMIEIGAILRCDIGRDENIKSDIESLLKSAATRVEQHSPSL